MNSDKKNKGILAFLILLILVIGYLSYKNAKDYEALQEIFQQEKNEVEQELDRIIANYDSAINKKIILSVNLEKKRNKLIALKDSVKKLEKNNFHLIKKFRKQVLNLEEENRKLFSAITSLNKEKEELQNENLLTKEELKEQSNITQQLTEQYEGLKSSNESLEDKITKASQVKINSLEVTALKLKSNKKYIETTKSKRTDAFRLSFLLLENEILKPGNLKLYINVLDKDMNCISSIGELQISKGRTVDYSKILNIDYKNKEERLISLIKVDREEIKVGVYSVNVFSDNKLIGFKYIELR